MPILLVFLRNTYKFQLKQKQNKKSVHSYSIFQLISAKPMARSLYVLPLPSLILMTTAVYYFSLLQIAVSRHGISTWKTGKKTSVVFFCVTEDPPTPQVIIDIIYVFFLSACGCGLCLKQISRRNHMM